MGDTGTESRSVLSAPGAESRPALRSFSDSEIGDLEAVFERADAESQGQFLMRVPKEDGTQASLMRHAEFSQDKNPVVTFFGYDGDGFLTVSGQKAEQINLQVKSRKDISSALSDADLRRIDRDDPDITRRMEKNLKMNLLSSRITMDAQRSIVDRQRSVFQKGEVGRSAAINKALSALNARSSGGK